jgi:hypothetical protein
MKHLGVILCVAALAFGETAVASLYQTTVETRVRGPSPLACGGTGVASPACGGLCMQ